MTIFMTFSKSNFLVNSMGTFFNIPETRCARGIPYHCMPIGTFERGGVVSLVGLKKGGSTQPNWKK